VHDAAVDIWRYAQQFIPYLSRVLSFRNTHQFPAFPPWEEVLSASQRVLHSCTQDAFAGSDIQESTEQRHSSPSDETTRPGIQLHDAKKECSGCSASSKLSYCVECARLDIMRLMQVDADYCRCSRLLSQCRFSFHAP
jgi:hypothetical protein